MKLLYVAPAISEVAAIDHEGAPRLHVSRFRAILPNEETGLFQISGFFTGKTRRHFFWSGLFRSRF